MYSTKCYEFNKSPVASWISTERDSLPLDRFNKEMKRLHLKIPLINHRKNNTHECQRLVFANNGGQIFWNKKDPKGRVIFSWTSLPHGDIFGWRRPKGRTLSEKVYITLVDRNVALLPKCRLSIFSEINMNFYCDYELVLNVSPVENAYIKCSVASNSR